MIINQNHEKQRLENFHGWHEREITKIPVVVTAAVHGHEQCGSAALLRLLEYFTEEKELLKHIDLILVPCVNPDGFDNNTRFNGKGFDLNRDFITQSQSETKAIARLIANYNPIALLDLHGYVCKDPYKIGLIEPCTKPHNPVYEYDLYYQSALSMAEYIERYLLDNKEKFTSKRYKEMTGTFIPLRDSASGWDDYTPFSVAMYSILHGTVGCTIEAPTRVADSISWLYLAVLGACEFIVENKQNLLQGHSEFFRRGKEGSHPFHPNGFFPDAYLLRKKSEEEAPLIELVQHLQSNGVHVCKKTNGEYYANLHQPKAVLAHTFLWTGEELSQQPLKMTDLCAWSLPLLWGVEAVPLYRRETAETERKDVPHSPEKCVKEQEKTYDTSLIGERENGTFSCSSGTKIISETLSYKQIYLAPKKKIAIVCDGGLYRKQSHAGARDALTLMGFSVTEIPPRKLADKLVLKNIDVLIYNGYEQLFYIAERMPKRYRQYVFRSISEREECVKNITEFIDAGGSFITIGAGGARAAKNFLKLTKVKVNVSGWNDNGIVYMRYIPGPMTEGYSQTDIGFVYRPVWFTGTDGAEVAAEYGTGPGSFIAGYWPEHQKAWGEAAILSEKGGRVILIGPEICHRAHTKYFYRLLVNAIKYRN